MFWASKKFLEEAEGIAGQAWARWEIDQLSYVQDPRNEPDAYATLTFVPNEWVDARIRRGQRLPTCLCGIPVEAKGKRWGVIVIDSIDYEALSGFKKESYDLLARVLQLFIQKV